MAGKSVLVAAHGNSLRAIAKYLEATNTGLDLQGPTECVAFAQGMTESDAESPETKKQEISTGLLEECFSAQVMEFNIPTGVPLVYELDTSLRVVQKCPLRRTSNFGES